MHLWLHPPRQSIDLSRLFPSIWKRTFPKEPLGKISHMDALAAVYAKVLSTTSGRDSIDIRMVIGALIVKHKLGLDDRVTVAMISENIYLQYFCGLQSF